VAVCLACGRHQIEPFLSFGRMPMADAFVDPASPGEEFFFNLAVGRCPGCTMVQLCERVPDARMFHDAYAYFSSTSARMRDHFARFAGEIIGRVADRAGAFVVEIGCNDGIMLDAFRDAGVRHLGVDPAGNVLAAARDRGLTVRQSFFTRDSAADIAAAHGPADVIAAANVVCHVADIHSLFDGVVRLLTADGLFIFEDPYVGAIVAQNAIDQIYDEHVFYFSAASVHGLAAAHGLELVDVTAQPVHGGELRYVLARGGRHAPSPRVEEWLSREAESGLGAAGTYAAFARRAAGIRGRLIAAIDGAAARGRRVAGYGATAKSSTIINYCGLGPAQVAFIADVTPGKQGKLTPGAHIPVRPPEYFRASPPDEAVLFAWNHEREILAKESWFAARGGRWLTYVPDVRYIPPDSASHA
jgi:methylation protein EvaC